MAWHWWLTSQNVKNKGSCSWQQLAGVQFCSNPGMASPFKLPAITMLNMLPRTFPQANLGKMAVKAVLYYRSPCTLPPLQRRTKWKGSNQYKYIVVDVSPLLVLMKCIWWRSPVSMYNTVVPPPFCALCRRINGVSVRPNWRPIYRQMQGLGVQCHLPHCRWPL